MGTPTDPRSLIGRELPAFTVSAERSRLILFAQVIGEEDPVYTDVAAARAAGHPDLPLPPTFLFSLDLERPDPRGVLRDLHVDMRQVLHGEQTFSYYRLAYAGQELRFASRIADYYEKKGGALRLLVRRTDVTHRGDPVAELTNTSVIRRLELS